MGESLFIEPMKRLFQKMRPKKAEGPEMPEEEAQLASVRDVFGLKTPAEGQATGEATRRTTAQSTSTGPGEAISELGLDLAQNVFNRGLDATPEPVVRPIGQPGIESPSTEEEGETRTPEHQPSEIQRVSIESTTEEEGAEETDTAVPLVRPISQEGAQAPQAGQREGASTSSPETPPRTRPASSEVLDSLSVSLKDVFRKKTVTNPQVKALLERHGAVDARELVDELHDLARSMGASEAEDEK